MIDFNPRRAVAVAVAESYKLPAILHGAVGLEFPGQVYALIPIAHTLPVTVQNGPAGKLPRLTFANVEDAIRAIKNLQNSV
jgi:hypothetical protein